MCASAPFVLCSLGCTCGAAPAHPEPASSPCAAGQQPRRNPCTTHATFWVLVLYPDEAPHLVPSMRSRAEVVGPRVNEALSVPCAHGGGLPTPVAAGSMGLPCSTNDVQCRVLIEVICEEKGREGVGALRGQVWSRHCAPAAPAFTQPSLPISSKGQCSEFSIDGGNAHLPPPWLGIENCLVVCWRSLLSVSPPSFGVGLGAWRICIHGGGGEGEGGGQRQRQFCW